MDAEVQGFLADLVSTTEAVLGQRLVAISLIGSLATGDPRPPNSDLDVLVVVDAAPHQASLRSLATNILPLGPSCPWRGLEYVAYQADVLRAPTHPLPYALNINVGPGREHHVSTGGDPSHWFLLDVSMARQHAIPVRGPHLRDLITEPARADTVRAIHDALIWHAAHHACSPDTVLNACRSWQWLERGGWMSKEQAARSALAHAGEPQHAAIIAEALAARRAGKGQLRQDGVVAFLAEVAHRARAQDCRSHRGDSQ